MPAMTARADVVGSLLRPPYLREARQAMREGRLDDAGLRAVVADEYAFLKAHARTRTKLTIPAPSWHRIFWHPEHSRAAYPTPEDFLTAIADYLRTRVIPRLIAAGGDYIQLDAPNYAQWH